MKRCVFCHFPARIAKFNNVWWSFFIPIQYAIKIAMWDCIRYEVVIFCVSKFQKKMGQFVASIERSKAKSVSASEGALPPWPPDLYSNRKSHKPLRWDEGQYTLLWLNGMSYLRNGRWEIEPKLLTHWSVCQETKPFQSSSVTSLHTRLQNLSSLQLMETLSVERHLRVSSQQQTWK